MTVLDRKRRTQVEAQRNKSELLNCLHQFRGRYSRGTGISWFTISLWTFSGKNSISLFYLLQDTDAKPRKINTHLLGVFPLLFLRVHQPQSVSDDSNFHFFINRAWDIFKYSRRKLYHRGIQLFTTELRVIYSTFAQSSCTSSIF